MALHIESILHMTCGSYTTNQLEAFINRRIWGRGEITLEETAEGLFWQEKLVPKHCFPVYLATDDPRRKAPAMWSEDCDDLGRESNAKQVWLPHDCLYRCPQTDGKWQSPMVYHYVTLCNEAHWVELLYLREEGADFERYELTDQPWEEEPDAQEFLYYEAVGVITITGVRHYCERLHIPAQLEGKPVSNVFLTNSSELCYLRELVVAEGVKKLDFSFGLRELEVISLPESVRLVRSPDSIRYSAWFRAQPEGPVYLQGYYCGTKGEPESDVLALREGTVGVVEWADSQRHWERLSIPSSLTYIAYGAFDDVHKPGKIELSEENKELEAHFSFLYPFRSNWQGKVPEGNCFSDAQPLEEPITGKALYELGRSSMAVKTVIPRAWLPTAPRLRYQHGWIAEYWYCADGKQDACYYASLRLPSGLPLELKQLDKNAHVSFGGCWTDAYLPPAYLRAEDYLDFCATVIQAGEPTEKLLAQLNEWWEALMPRDVLEAAQQKDDTHLYTAEEPKSEGYPWPMKPLPKESRDFWTWERVKNLLLKRYGFTEQALLQDYRKEKK